LWRSSYTFCFSVATVATVCLVLSQVRLAMVDATEEKALAERFEVRGFPSLKLFRGGDPAQWTEYSGGRGARDLVAYLKKQTGPAAQLVVDGAEMARSLAQHGPAAGRVLVGGFFADTDGPAAKLFLAAAARVG
jgi:protein disulfide-isomerase A1